MPPCLRANQAQREHGDERRSRCGGWLVCEDKWTLAWIWHQSAQA